MEGACGGERDGRGAYAVYGIGSGGWRLQAHAQVGSSQVRETRREKPHMCGVRAVCARHATPERDACMRSGGGCRHPACRARATHRGARDSRRLCRGRRRRRPARHQLPYVVLRQHGLCLGRVDRVELVRGICPRRDEDAVGASGVLVQVGGGVVHLQRHAMRADC